MYNLQRKRSAHHFCIINSFSSVSQLICLLILANILLAGAQLMAICGRLSGGMVGWSDQILSLILLYTKKNYGVGP